MTARIKICGLSTPATLDAALQAGADMVGFVFFPRSPRHLTLDFAPDLAMRVEGRAEIVALTVDADDRTMDEIMEAVQPRFIQLHGTETPARVAEIGRRTGVATIKAVGVSSRDDALRAQDYAGVADMVLFDAKPPRGAALPGGNGAAFDWTVLRDGVPTGAWMLSGGLHAGNVVAALAETRAPIVDVSSGVETSPGEKDGRLIRAFIAAVRGVPSQRESV